MRLPAVIAYGVAVMGWRGLRVVKSAAPLVLTAISSQRSTPVNTPAPGSSVAVKRPLLTASVAASGFTPTARPPMSASRTVNWKL